MLALFAKLSSSEAMNIKLCHTCLNPSIWKRNYSQYFDKLFSSKKLEKVFVDVSSFFENTKWNLEFYSGGFIPDDAEVIYPSSLPNNVYVEGNSYLQKVGIARLESQAKNPTNHSYLYMPPATSLVVRHGFFSNDKTINGEVYSFILQFSLFQPIPAETSLCLFRVGRYAEYDALPGTINLNSEGFIEIAGEKTGDYQLNFGEFHTVVVQVILGSVRDASITVDVNGTKLPIHKSSEFCNLNENGPFSLKMSDCVSFFNCFGDSISFPPVLVSTCEIYSKILNEKVLFWSARIFYLSGNQENKIQRKILSIN